MSRRKTLEERKEQANEVHGGKYDYSLWPSIVSNNTKVISICPKHGEFEQALSNHVRAGSGCPKCANAVRNDNNRKTHKQARSEIIKRNKTLPPVHFKDGEVYTTALVKYKWICEKGHTWEAKFGDVVLYGHGCPTCSIDRRFETNLKKYGCHPNQRHLSEEQLEKINDVEWLKEQHIKKERTVTDISFELGVGVPAVLKILKKHGIEYQYNKKSYSDAERQICEFLDSIDVTYHQNDRKLIYPNELDFFIPSHSLAIEFDGIYWHGETKGRDKKYHISKTTKCNDNGVRLIHIFENEWILKEEIVKSRMKSLFGKNETIYARQCEIVIVSSKTKQEFFEKTHIQGDAKSAFCYGLMYEGKLVSVMSFGISRYSKSYQYELIRFSNELNVNVVGGANRLFKHFIKEFQPDSVVSYCDLRWNTGDVYKKLGFDFSHNSEPNYHYYKRNELLTLHSRVKFQKHKLHKLLEDFNPSLTEWENMVNHGYDRIWDCGNSVWCWRP